MEDALLAAIQAAARAGNLEMSLHAAQEAYGERKSADEIQQALASGRIRESYPEHRRGPCCLVSGETREGRPLHVVCTTEPTPVLIITVYEPRPPKWMTPTQRAPRQ